ncbi:hypothetical protein [Kordia jejudonensis]|uniref:hypothetical protein n=1 Tax=Kordia jejudonensis TaxID=1348245 RepID=UPI00062984B8|nr:hypothetical protein [Kordia jejudonensis]
MTRQIRDTLIFEDQEYRINTYILDSRIDKSTAIKNKSSGVTALHRGYKATFSIKDDFLYIQNLEAFSRGGTFDFVSILKENFPHSKRCDWFSGLLRIDDRKGSFEDEKEDHIFEFLEIFKGHLVKKHTMNYFEFQQFKAAQFKEFKKTEEYEALYKNIYIIFDDPYKLDTYIMQNILNFIKEVK